VKANCHRDRSSRFIAASFETLLSITHALVALSEMASRN
jgi:hypothetical protein